jgi:Glycosyltransferase family 28 C-terminal domain
VNALRSDSQATPQGQLPVLLATSNGTGLGHLTRQLAVVLGLADRADATIFSLSTGLPIVSDLGMRGEYCPSYDRGWIPRARWHGYLRDRLVALVEETGARLVVFDGVVPYLGVLWARAAVPEVAFVWMRRGMWRRRSSTSALASRPFFDLIIEPGDLATSADDGPTAQLGDSVHVPPVMLQEFMPALSRGEAAAELGLDPDRPTALVTLSSGRLNDVDTAGAAAVRALLADPEWQVAVTRSHVAQGQVPLIDPTRVVALRGVYPLSRYLTAFDAAVGAAGYNTFHEMLLSGIPTLFVPNRFSETDDQVARAQWANANGLALVANELDVRDVEAQASRLHNEGERKQLAGACATLPPATGGTATAEALLDLMRGYTGHRPTLWERVRVAELVGKAAAVRALGGFGSSLVRRALGKPAQVGPLRAPPPCPVATVGYQLWQRIEPIRR